MNRPRVADDFDAIRARIEELRRERERATRAERDVPLGERELTSERRRRERLEGAPPPWVPTIFVKRPGF